MTKAKAEEFYSVHKERPFFGELVGFFSSSMTVGAIIQGRDAVATVRRMVGATKSWESAPGYHKGRPRDRPDGQRDPRLRLERVLREREQGLLLLDQGTPRAPPYDLLTPCSKIVEAQHLRCSAVTCHS